MKKGVLLLNLGTPDNYSRTAVTKYLREFLVDPRVITLPRFIRWILVYCVILPFRPKQTCHAYRLIWQKEGSPLLIHSNALKSSLADSLPDNYQVALGMRYGNPSIKDALALLKDCETLDILPLFPQYASATTGSAIESIFNTLKNTTLFPTIHIKRDFYNEHSFIDAQAALIQSHLGSDDFLLCSYHGLPEQHLVPMGCLTPCQSTCTQLSNNPGCYRAQCYETTRLIQKRLNLPNDRITTSFQSRLGKTPWIRPYTDHMLTTLREKGIEHLAISCPSFIADCLETLEEIGIGIKKQWMALGGKSFKLIPCLNNNPGWVKAIRDFIIK